MSDPGNPIFTRHTRQAFIWTTSEWRGNPLWCMVSFELVRTIAKINLLRVNYEFCIGRYRLRIVRIDMQSEIFHCVRVSSSREESVRGVFLFMREIVSSVWNYYFGNKSLPEHRSFLDNA